MRRRSADTRSGANCSRRAAEGGNTIRRAPPRSSVSGSRRVSASYSAFGLARSAALQPSMQSPPHSPPQRLPQPSSVGSAAARPAVRLWWDAVEGVAVRLAARLRLSWASGVRGLLLATVISFLLELRR